MIDVVSKVLESSFQNVISQEGTKVSHMGTVVDGGAAGVHFDFPRFQRLQGFFGARLGIIQKDFGS